MTEETKLTLTEESWRDLFRGQARAWRNFARSAGRKNFEHFSASVIEFYPIRPETEVVKCQGTHGFGIVCERCWGEGHYRTRTGPGVMGPDVVVEVAAFKLTAWIGPRRGGKYVTAHYVYRRGLVASDNRTGGTELKRLK